MSLRKQGASKGAVSAFLISTPESGVDSIAVTYALMDPVMTVARPAAAFVTAVSAGLAENLTSKQGGKEAIIPNLGCPVDNCCDGVDCDPEKHRAHHTFFEKFKAGFGFAFGELWGDIAGWFFMGMLLAGMITAFIPTDWMSRYMGGGLPTMLVMLGVGMPLYICATASTPIAAALILKGISPGAALVFLLAGPATNMTSVSVLTATLGRRSTAIYLGAIAFLSVVCGLILDGVYAYFGLSAKALLEAPKELFPDVFGLLGAVLLSAISVRPVVRKLRALIRRKDKKAPASETEPAHHSATSHSFSSKETCACSGST